MGEDIIFKKYVIQSEPTVKKFTLAKVTIMNNSQWMDKVKNIATEIENNLNPRQANSSITRSADDIKIDNLSGLIAEYACFDFLKFILKYEEVTKPSNNNAKNQIDIMVGTPQKSIEVRSSFVNNGIEFAVNSGCIHVIGPYINDYKKTENVKDFYMRVIYGFKKTEFESKLKDNYLELFITGGATKEMMDNAKIIVHMEPADADFDKKSDYNTAIKNFMC